MGGHTWYLRAALCLRDLPVSTAVTVTSFMSPVNILDPTMTWDAWMALPGAQHVSAKRWGGVLVVRAATCRTTGSPGHYYLVVARPTPLARATFRHHWHHVPTCTVWVAVSSRTSPLEVVMRTKSMTSVGSWCVMRNTLSKKVLPEEDTDRTRSPTLTSPTGVTPLDSSCTMESPEKHPPQLTLTPTKQAPLVPGKGPTLGLQVGDGGRDRGEGGKAPHTA